MLPPLWRSRQHCLSLNALAFVVPFASVLAAAAAPPPSGGLAIELAPNEFIVAGTGLVITFASREPGKIAGIESAEESRFVDGEWQNIRRLGSDQTHQGRHVRLESGRFSLQRVKLYTY